MLGNMKYLNSTSELTQLLGHGDLLVKAYVWQALLRLKDYSVLPRVSEFFNSQPEPPRELLLPRDRNEWVGAAARFRRHLMSRGRMVGRVRRARARGHTLNGGCRATRTARHACIAADTVLHPRERNDASSHAALVLQGE